jgi:hypothetical protein
MTDTMDITTMGKNEHTWNTLERYHIYNASRESLHMNDTYNETCNPTFEVLQEINTK